MNGRTILAQRPMHSIHILLPMILVLAALMLSCNLVQEKPGPKNPTTFGQEDCSLGEVIFKTITATYVNEGDNSGPYLICSTIEQGPHDSITYYYSVIAYKADKLDQYYKDLKSVNRSFVDQAAEWNANPDVPPEAYDTVNMIRNDENSYIFMITEDSNVQNCWRGSGYGAEKVNGKYLVSFHYASCELGNDKAYADMLLSVEKAALNAIQRLSDATGGTR